MLCLVTSDVKLSHCFLIKVQEKLVFLTLKPYRKQVQFHLNILKFDLQYERTLLRIFFCGDNIL